MSESNLSEKDVLLSEGFDIRISKPLAAKLGLPNATILGYFHEALQTPTCLIDGVPWIEKSYIELAEEIQGLGESSIRRRVKKLESQGLLESCRISTKQYRQTKSYTICYDAVKKILQD